MVTMRQKVENAYRELRKTMTPEEITLKVINKRLRGKPNTVYTYLMAIKKEEHKVPSRKADPQLFWWIVVIVAVAIVVLSFISFPN